MISTVNDRFNATFKEPLKAWLRSLPDAASAEVTLTVMTYTPPGPAFGDRGATHARVMMGADLNRLFQQVIGQIERPDTVAGMRVRLATSQRVDCHTIVPPGLNAARIVQILGRELLQS